MKKKNQPNKKSHNKKVQSPPIEYPTWKVQGHPTPSEKLIICDFCRTASWTQHSSNVSICWCKDGKKRRMREATPEEYKKANNTLEEIIG
jgi:hypothetical protein